MGKKKETENITPETEQVEKNIGDPIETQQSGFDGERRNDEASENASTETCEGCAIRDAALAAAEDKYLRLAAEYDNFRKRSAKEKESAWADSKASTALAFLPVYDNLERALKAPCSDEAYQKGVEMTMNQLKEVLTKLGIEEIPALGEKFDPNCHNAVMHVDDDSVEDNTVVEVFQTGFKSGDKIVRFSMVKVAN